MAEENLDILATVLAVQACLQAICSVLASDGRRAKRPRAQQFTVRTNLWENVESSNADGWYRANLRMSRKTFDKTVIMLENHAKENGFATPAANAHVDFRMQVAITLQHLSQESGFQATASTFGVSKSTALRCVNFILDILVDLSPTIIRYQISSFSCTSNFQFIFSFPRTAAEWDRLASDFEKPVAILTSLEQSTAPSLE